jgi:putative ABC transport system ATP-binding protein
VTVTDIHRGPLYELRDVTKTFGEGVAEVHALRELDLTIDEGELVAIAGPSGSGKTTLLQLLGALDRPSTGHVLFEGRDLASLGDTELTSLRAATIGFVFQQFNLIPTLTARQNVEVALATQSLASEVRRSKAEHLLSSVGLERRGDHLPSMLSGGEQQRVAIARALANEPRVLLADEPTGNLDSATGEEIMALLRSLSLERRQTIVVVTHNQEIARTAARVIRMQDGGVVDEERAAAKA